MNFPGKLLRAGIQSGSIMGISDGITQVVIEGKSIGSEIDTENNNRYDGFRTIRWAGLGLVLHGPYFFVGFSQLDRRFVSSAANPWKIVFQKTVTAQLFLFPPYLVALFGLLGILEGHPDVLQKIQSRVPEAFVNGCIYWPIANGINFKLVPSTMRVPYLALSAGAWNSYLSYTNSKAITSSKVSIAPQESPVTTD